MHGVGLGVQQLYVRVLYPSLDKVSLPGGYRPEESFVFLLLNTLFVVLKNIYLFIGDRKDMQTPPSLSVICVCCRLSYASTGSDLQHHLEH